MGGKKGGGDEGKEGGKRGRGEEGGKRGRGKGVCMGGMD